MAASDARPVPRKNAAFRFYFAIRKPSDSTLITTWAGADSEVSLDGASFADCTNEATEIGTSGCGYIDLEAAEMNADSVVLKITVTNSGAVPLVFTLFPEEAGDYRLSAVPPTAVQVADEVQTRTIARVTLVDTCTVNSDMRGTDNAALAATALSTATWTGTLATNIGTTNSTVASNLDATVSSRLASASYTSPPSASTISTQVAADLAAAHGAGSWATATGFSTHSAADVWAVATRTITGGSLTTAPPTAAAIADAVWDEARTGHDTAGTFGFYLDAAISGISAGSGATAQQVWEYATRGLTEAAELDSATLQKIDDIREDTGTTLPGLIGGIEGGGAGLTGPYTRTITVTDADTDEPIEGAKVRLYRTGETGTVATDDDGIASFTVEAATWSYGITASGYTGVSGSVVVGANGNTDVQMEAVSITPGTSDNTTGYLVTRTNGVAANGLAVSYQMAETPTGDTGSSYDATVYSATSVANGIAELTLVRGAKYWIWRGQIRRPEETEMVLIPANAGDTYELPSHLG